MPTDPTFRIGSAALSNMTDNVDAVTVDSKNTDAATGQDETEWINTKWSQYYGYYKAIPEVKTAIDMRAIWTIGKGFETQTPIDKVTLKLIRGTGKSSFNSILKNMIVVRRIGGDSFAEIIRGSNGELLNLKCLDPGSIKIVCNSKGMITKYIQVSKNPKNKKEIVFLPKDIFHLTNKLVADSISGTSDIEAIEAIIKANNESFVDSTKLQHRTVKPIWCFKLNEDHPGKIAAFSAKMDAAVNKGENIYIPKDTVEFELMAVPSNSTLNPLPWREHLKNYFYQVVGIPQIVLGNAAEFSESSAKIAYLAFQQSVEDEQLDIEENIFNQLYITVKLSFPATMQNEMISDDSKDGQDAATGFQPQDMVAGRGAE